MYSFYEVNQSRYNIIIIIYRYKLIISVVFKGRIQEINFIQKLAI